MSLELRTYGRPDVGFAIDLPSRSEVLEDFHGAAVVAIEPNEPGAFRANLNVVVEALGEPLELEAYADRSLSVQQQELEGFRLIDRTPELLAEGLGAVRTLGHHEMGGQAIVLEQWRVVQGAMGYVISASCGALDYDAVSDTLSACAESFRTT